MKKNLKLLVLAVMLCYFTFSTMALAASFKDVPAGAEYAEAVNTLADIGILTGDGNGNFNPNNTITRAEFATIICRLLGVADDAKAIKQSSFSDVTASHWAVGYIAKANELGIINGNGDGTFSPESPVTQEQAVKMLVCAWGWEDVALSSGGYPNGFIEVATNLGINEEIVVGNEATRKQIASLCFNILSVSQYDSEE